ncbi:MAG: tautomerase family protein [Desulfovibrio sp.]|nr:tautomerase family protein [Desulfovibrio sp.]
MPVVTLEAAKLNYEQKKQLVAEFTETVARITGLPKTSIFVFLKENSPENIGVAGQLLTEKKEPVKA